jgi:CheY-like chemotaxis protein
MDAPLIVPRHSCDDLPSGLTALVAEDEPLIALDVDALLHELGVQRVLVVSSLAEGLRAVATEALDFALLDVRLGRESCFPLAARLEAAGVPFAFVTGYPSSIVPPAFSQVPLLAKPYLPANLGAVVMHLIAGR